MTLKHLALAVAETARISAPTLLDGMRGRLTAQACDERLASWSARLLEQAGITLQTHGLDNAPDDEAFVVMSNHRSHYDIPVMFQALRRRVRMVAKTELFKVPGWGPAMRHAGFVEVNRKDRVQAIQSLERAKAALLSGTNIWIAPEGTRGPGGDMLPFKQGGFHLALSTGARILPVSIRGTSEVLAAHGRRVQEGVTVTVTVSAPLATAEYGEQGRGALIEDVRHAIEAGLGA